MRLTITILRFALVLFVSSTAVVSNNAFFVPAIRRSRLPPSSTSIGQRSSSKSCVGIFLQSDNNNNNVNNDEKHKTPENKPITTTITPTTMVKGTRPSMIPILYNIEAAITFGAIIFVLIGFILQVFGYSYVVENGHLRIDTLEYRQFHDEVIKAASKRTGE